MELGEQGYTHVIGLFLSSGISGFWANSQFLIEDHAKLKVAFHETKITAAPMGAMVRNVLHWSEQGMSFENILKKLEEQVENTTAYILVDASSLGAVELAVALHYVFNTPDDKIVWDV